MSMEDFYKNPGEQPEEKPINPEEVDDLKEAVVNPDKKEIESRFQGMKDLFTAILQENKKDYEYQIAEMKKLFTTIMEENRKQFKEQLQDLYKELPKIIHEADRLRQDEQYVFIEESEYGVPKGKPKRHTRLDAVKELIAGHDTELLYKEIGEMQNHVSKVMQQQKESLAEVVDEIYERVQAMEEKVQAAIRNLQNDFMLNIKQVEEEGANRFHVAGLLRKLADEVKPPFKQ
ncbi:hypothetical protein [Thermonema rossianum]|uniref:hypothetical protein n=1 Tax=Thermonema rossianum TaxID=55505 RepID=UPI0012F9D2EE|nr:hypothetical protein [Thermonema rossianum]